jgi:hypothetical protein
MYMGVVASMHGSFTSHQFSRAVLFPSTILSTLSPILLAVHPPAVLVGKYFEKVNQARCFVCCCCAGLATTQCVEYPHTRQPPPTSKQVVLCASRLIAACTRSHPPKPLQR